jgi:hypothetical protein
VPLAPFLGADTVAALYVELAHTTGDPRLAGPAAALLGELHARGQRCTTTMGLLLPRLLATAAALVGDGAAAHAQIEAAIRLAVQLRAHAELARARLVAGELLIADGQTAAAARQLDQARHLAGSLGMEPLVRRAATVAGVPGAPPADAAASTVAGGHTMSTPTR